MRLALFVKVVLGLILGLAGVSGVMLLQGELVPLGFPRHYVTPGWLVEHWPILLPPAGLAIAILIVMYLIRRSRSSWYV